MSRLIKPYRGIMPLLDPSAVILDNTSIIGDVHIGSESSIWYGCTVRGDVNEIRIGAQTNLQDGSVIHVAKYGQGSYLGDRITIGHMALIHACTLEDDCFVGMKAIVLDGARIESFGMLAAGAMLTPGKVLPSGELWAGVPARKMRDLTEDDLEMMRRTTLRYVKLAKEHRNA